MICFRDTHPVLPPRPFPLSTIDNIVIAPFWDHFDKQNGGQVFFRLTDNQALLNEIGTTINDTLEFDFTPTKLLIVTWRRIPDIDQSQKIV